MSQQLVSSFSFESHPIQVIVRNNEVWFIASEVSTVFGYRDANKLTRILDDDEKDTHNVGTLGGKQNVSIINESGLYHAVLKSRKPEAKRFRKWVTSEVLPQIRKTGSYQRPQFETVDIRDYAILHKHNFGHLVNLFLLAKQQTEVMKDLYPALSRLGASIAPRVYTLATDPNIGFGLSQDKLRIIIQRFAKNDEYWQELLQKFDERFPKRRTSVRPRGTPLSELLPFNIDFKD